MSNKNYAVIKDNVVVNIVVFDDPTEELLELFKNEYNADDILEVNDSIYNGSTYDGVKFIPPKPFESWILNEENCQWYAPVSYPTNGKPYTWDEPTTSWVEVPL
jgi:hypothetical protein